MGNKFGGMCVVRDKSKEKDKFGGEYRPVKKSQQRVGKRSMNASKQKNADLSFEKKISTFEL